MIFWFRCSRLFYWGLSLCSVMDLDGGIIESENFGLTLLFNCLRLIYDTFSILILGSGRCWLLGSAGYRF